MSASNRGAPAHEGAGATNTDAAIIEVPKNARAVYRVTPAEFKGHRYVDLRVWYRNGDDELRPSAKGVAIKPEALAAIVDALQRAAAALEAGR